MKAKEKYFGESNTEEINRIIESLRTQGQPFLIEVVNFMIVQKNT